MKRIGDLMKDLGFNKDAPLETQKAFIKHLIKAAESSVSTAIIAPVPIRTEAPKVKAVESQLSFDADVLGAPATDARLKFRNRP